MLITLESKPKAVWANIGLVNRGGGACLSYPGEW